MNMFRYYLALVCTLMLPLGLLIWIIVHPFIKFWRRVGLLWTYVMIAAVACPGVAGLFLMRRTLMAVDFGANWLLLVLGLLCVALAVRLRVSLHRHFSNKQLFGLPELAPDRYPQQLVTEGLHARVRHPRYLQFLLTAAGFALMANYLALYLMVAACLPVLWLIVILEEKELRARFGPAYDHYCRQVPRFVPRRRA
jgi:protein-S-isoprenylcysteine O-methyltransferase Ste14